MIWEAIQQVNLLCWQQCPLPRLAVYIFAGRITIIFRFWFTWAVNQIIVVPTQIGLCCVATIFLHYCRECVVYMLDFSIIRGGVEIPLQLHTQFVIIVTS